MLDPVISEGSAVSAALKYRVRTGIEGHNQRATYQLGKSRTSQIRKLLARKTRLAGLPLFTLRRHVKLASRAPRFCQADCRRMWHPAPQSSPKRSPE